ncbi:hypothetical protein H9P43_000389 [Blastocladiella emersonii ATCC 22665]|nr:hypothetical protein H9P43_000389 [Blastocladiella emersonii ATCC 22665]
MTQLTRRISHRARKTASAIRSRVHSWRSASSSAGSAVSSPTLGRDELSSTASTADTAAEAASLPPTVPRPTGWLRRNQGVTATWPQSAPADSATTTTAADASSPPSPLSPQPVPATTADPIPAWRRDQELDWPAPSQPHLPDHRVESTSVPEPAAIPLPPSPTTDAVATAVAGPSAIHDPRLRSTSLLRNGTVSSTNAVRAPSPSLDAATTSAAASASSSIDPATAFPSFSCEVSSTGGYSRATSVDHHYMPSRTLPPSASAGPVSPFVLGEASAAADTSMPSLPSIVAVHSLDQWLSSPSLIPAGITLGLPSTLSFDASDDNADTSHHAEAISLVTIVPPAHGADTDEDTRARDHDDDAQELNFFLSSTPSSPMIHPGLAAAAATGSLSGTNSIPRLPTGPLGHVSVPSRPQSPRYSTAPTTPTWSTPARTLLRDPPTAPQVPTLVEGDGRFDDGLVPALETASLASYSRDRAWNATPGPEASTGRAEAAQPRQQTAAQGPRDDSGLSSSWIGPAGASAAPGASSGSPSGGGSSDDGSPASSLTGATTIRAPRSTTGSTTTAAGAVPPDPPSPRSSSSTYQTVFSHVNAHSPGPIHTAHRAQIDALTTYYESRLADTAHAYHAELAHLRRERDRLAADLARATDRAANRKQVSFHAPDLLDRLEAANRQIEDLQAALARAHAETRELREFREMRKRVAVGPPPPLPRVHPEVAEIVAGALAGLDASVRDLSSTVAHHLALVEHEDAQVETWGPQHVFEGRHAAARSVPGRAERLAVATQRVTKDMARILEGAATVAEWTARLEGDGRRRPMLGGAPADLAVVQHVMAAARALAKYLPTSSTSSSDASSVLATPPNSPLRPPEWALHADALRRDPLLPPPASAALESALTGALVQLDGWARLVARHAHREWDAMNTRLIPFLAVVLAVLAACASAAPVTPSAAAVALDKRGPKTWFDSKIINPIVDKRVQPVLKTTIDAAVEAAKPAIIGEMPKVFRQTFAEVLGVAPIVDNVPKCGWFQPLCNAVIRPLDKLVDGIKLKAKTELNLLLEDSKKHCTAAAIKGIKKQLYLSDESKAALDKRGLKDWYHTKVNSFMRGVMTELRAEIHVIVTEMSQRYIGKLPGFIQEGVNTFLPDSLKTPVPQHIVGKRGVLDAIRAKIEDWEKAIVAAIKDQVEDAIMGLEDQLMTTITTSTRKAVADALPFYDEADAKFKN